MFNHPFKARERVQVLFVDEFGEPLESLTQQSFKDECDVNNILRRYDQTGLITHVQQVQGQYGDFTQVNEYRESLDVVRHAQDSFLALPAKVREQFGNDPGSFIEFVTNPQNAGKMVEMGLASPVKEVKPLANEIAEAIAASRTQSEA